MENKKKKIMLSTRDVQQLIGCGRDHAYQLMNSNQFPTIKVGRMRFVNEEIFLQWTQGKKF
jgi:predicted DNA-binding transcriptional regulator AlpA